MLTSQNLANLRASLFGVTGAICFLYAALALLNGRPDPMPFWIPAAFGIMSAVVIFIGAQLAGRDRAAQAFDEGYAADRQKAERYAFWIALMLYPLFALPLINGLINAPTAYAAMGTLTGGSYLVLAVWFEKRGQ